MIPVHGSGKELVPDLAMLVISELEAVERGIRVLARSVPLEEGVVIDAFALDVDGRPVLVLVDNGAEEMHARCADALLAYRRSRALLARLLGSDAFDETIDPRLMLVARRFADRTEARCRLLPGPGATLVEVAIVDGATGRQVLLLARGGERSVKRAPNLRLIAGPEEIAAGEAKAVPPHAEGRAADPIIPAPAAAAPPAESAEPETRWLDEVKARVLRISPDVLEERDGSLSRFRWGDHVLVTVSLDGGDVVAIFQDGGDPVLVTDRVSCSEVLDIVFERFFNLAATRRRSGAKSAPGARLHEPRVAARMDV